jgi:hypothetical protein
LATLLVVAAAVLAPVLGARGTQADRAAAWVRAHSESLPTRLDAINRYPAEYQRQIYTALQADKKLALWREYILRIAEAADVLAPSQRLFLKRAADVPTVDDFRWGAPQSERTRFLIAEAGRALATQRGVVAAHGIWSSPLVTRRYLGGGFWETLRGYRVRLNEYLLSGGSVSASGDNCDCWLQEEGIYDCQGKFCNPRVQGPPPWDDESCRYVSSGCGLFDNEPCDGFCSGGPS